MSELSTAAVLEDPVAVELLGSTEPARLAYTWTDAPRVVPIWFHWDGRRLVFGSPAGAPKVAVLRERPDVAVTTTARSAARQLSGARHRTVRSPDAIGVCIDRPTPWTGRVRCR